MNNNSKRLFPFSPKVQTTPPSKKTKLPFKSNQKSDSKDTCTNTLDLFDVKKTNLNATDAVSEPIINNQILKKSHVPLAEKMRPNEFNDYFGQTHLVGPNTILHDLLKNGEIPSMILWGPPGCGKTSLVNVIMKESKKMYDNSLQFIKLSATTSNINDVRKAVADAQTQAKQGRRTVVFMDEIHRFNKLQQDIFLPHVEAGTFILIGATTENPSSGLNSALLSRCRVFVLKKLQKDELITILTKAIESMEGTIAIQNKSINESNLGIKFIIDQSVVEWLSEICNGDARVALSGLEMAVQAKILNDIVNTKPIVLNISDIKDSFERTQILSKKSDNVHHMHSALHHCIRAGNDNAALYWLARIMEEKEDPVYIARRLVKIASEDIGIIDDEALSTAVHTMHACQMIGMPECDVLLAQCVVYLSQSEKSREIVNAFGKAMNVIENHKGPQPQVPLFIKDRSGENKLKATLGKDYKNLIRNENKNKNHLPAGLEDVNFFND